MKISSFEKARRSHICKNRIPEISERLNSISEMSEVRKE